MIMRHCTVEVLVNADIEGGEGDAVAQPGHDGWWQQPSAQCSCEPVKLATTREHAKDGSMFLLCLAVQWCVAGRQGWLESRLS